MPRHVQFAPVCRRTPALLILVWSATLMLAGCSSDSGLAYRLRQGDEVAYRYTEVITTTLPVTAAQAPGTPAPALPARIDFGCRVVLRVTATDGQIALVQLAMTGATVETTDSAGVRQVEQPPDSAATLRLRAGTGEVLDVSGEIKFLTGGGVPLNMLDAFRQTLQRYPELAPLPGTRWPAAVHAQLARPLSENFSGEITYMADEMQNGQTAARLAINGQGDLASGPGRLIVAGTALVDRKTGLPISENDEARVESPGMTLVSRMTITRE